MAYVIAVLNQKGGVGKTTISCNLACALAQDHPGEVLLVDQDPQGSSLDWNEVNGGSLIPVLGMSRETLPVDLKAVSDNYQYIVIDGAPAADKLAAAALKVADLVILPVTPSAYDVWATADLVDLIKTRQEVAGGMPESAFIISRAIKHSLIGEEVSAALSEYGLPILSSRTSNLLSYPTAAGRGHSVLMERYSQAKEEIMAIKNEIKDTYL